MRRLSSKNRHQDREQNMMSGFRMLRNIRRKLFSKTTNKEMVVRKIWFIILHGGK
jgi:hypothetical protein